MWKSRGCIATSYLPLSDIAKLQHIYGVSGDKVDVIHTQLMSRVTPNMEGNGINEENIEPWVKNKNSSSH